MPRQQQQPDQPFRRLAWFFWRAAVWLARSLATGYLARGAGAWVLLATFQR